MSNHIYPLVFCSVPFLELSKDNINKSSHNFFPVAVAFSFDLRPDQDETTCPE